LYRCGQWLPDRSFKKGGRVVLLTILTVTANHTMPNLQQMPGMTCERSTPYFVPRITPSARRSLQDLFLTQIRYCQALQPLVFVIQWLINETGTIRKLRVITATGTTNNLTQPKSYSNSDINTTRAKNRIGTSASFISITSATLCCSGKVTPR
jgi:hypothetical protein